MSRVLVVDGSNLLFQMFFGVPARILNNQGKAIQRTLIRCEHGSPPTPKESKRSGRIFSASGVRLCV